jgi:deoxyribonuclease V
MSDLWPTTLDAAQRVQEQLRSQVRTDDDAGEITTVAGIDAGYSEEEARAAIVVLEFPSLKPLDYTVARVPVTFPYVPGFLSFREGPGILAALQQLTVKPDLLICDGQGIAHPRRFGIACHIGVLSGIPALGCAKSLLTGRHGPLEPQRGAQAELMDRKEVIGVALRTRTNTRPVYISVGHRISLARAVDIVLACSPRYRLPETTRLAHNLASHNQPPEGVGLQGGDA